MSTLHALLSFIASAALLGLLLIVCEIGLTVWRAITGPEVDPATLPARRPAPVPRPAEAVGVMDVRYRCCEHCIPGPGCPDAHLLQCAHPACPEVDPATLPARDRHPSRALPRRWE